MKRKSTSRIEHVAADPPEDPDFPMNFGEFAKLTNVLELAKIEIQNKKIYPKRTRVAYKARVLYKQFYKEPQLRNCAPLNALIWNLRSTAPEQAIAPKNEAMPSINRFLEAVVSTNEEEHTESADSNNVVPIKFNIDDLPPLPVAFEEFDRGTNIRDLAMNIMQQSVNDDHEEMAMCARLLHAVYYVLPVTRRIYPLNELRIRQNCPEEIHDVLNNNLSVPEEEDLPVTEEEFQAALNDFLAAKKYKLEHTCP